MFKSRVACWFCNEESYVYFFRKNSWNCENCGQYNGFNKDGDYNKPIPEMQIQTNKKYCVTTSSNGNKAQMSSSNFLCEKCNNNQEMKLIELKNFESRSDEKSDEEYNLYKKKLDQIYDLCPTCKTKLNMHLRKQDQQIGCNLVKKRKPILPEAFKQSALNKIEEKSSSNGIQTKDVEMEDTNHVTKANNTFDFGFSSTIKKAYTIAGTVPAYVIGNASNGRREIHNHSRINSSIKTSQYENTNGSQSSSSPKHLNENGKSSFQIATGSLGIIFEDMIILVLNILVFICDFVNLLNDSDLWNDDHVFKSDDFTWFQFFLTIYKHIVTILLINFILSLHLIYKRPKMSRILTMLGFLFSAIIHLHLIAVRMEEQFIVEVFISFFMVSYLIVGRIYNVYQLIRYL